MLGSLTTQSACNRTKFDQISLSELESHRNCVHSLPPVRLHLIILFSLSSMDLSIEIVQLLLTL